MRGALALLGFVGIIFGGTEADAGILTPVDLPRAFVSFSCSGSIDATYSATGCEAGNSSAKTELGRFPEASAVATYPGNLALVQSGASAGITYSFAVTGGTDGQLVPVDVYILMVGSSSDGGGSYYFASAKVTTDQGAFSRTICTFGCGPGDGAESYSGISTIYASAGHINLIEMSAVAANGLSMDSLAAYASSDPYIYIDPSFPDADKYSIVVSADVGNSPPGVPEPTSWAMMIGGLALAGAAMRHRQAVVSFAKSR